MAALLGNVVEGIVIHPGVVLITHLIPVLRHQLQF